MYSSFLPLLPLDRTWLLGIPLRSSLYTKRETRTGMDRVQLRVWRWTSPRMAHIPERGKSRPQSSCESTSDFLRLKFNLSFQAAVNLQIAPVKYFFLKNRVVELPEEEEEEVLFVRFKTLTHRYKIQSCPRQLLFQSTRVKSQEKIDEL